MQDRYTGLLPRWQIHFNLTMLRLISYGMDRYWANEALQSGKSSGNESDPVSAVSAVR